MYIENISSSNRLSIGGISLDFFAKTNTTTDEQRELINELIKTSDEIYLLPNISIRIRDNEEPRYTPKAKRIFI